MEATQKTLELMGHNNPPVYPHPDTLPELLRIAYHDNIVRTEQLKDAAQRFTLDHAKIETQAQCDVAADLASQLAANNKLLDGLREHEKAPWLAGGNAVDGLFNGDLRTPSIRWLDKLNGLVRSFKIEEENRARRAREEEARRAREEAERRAAEERAQREREEAAKREAEKAQREREDADRRAREAIDAAARQRAEEEALAAKRRAAQAEAEADAASKAGMEEAAARQRAEADARQAQKAASGSAANLTRTRTSTGSLTSLRTTWDFEVEDIHKIPADYLTVNRSAILAVIKANKGNVTIPGIRVIEDRGLTRR